ncbi:MAG: succinate dehydrogenase, cytochrome b556 subunit [Maricaulaceae bacterium]|nr:succinate dehydrogenase, cytochrome b556 subunit [Maricaulaceae bacterium]
MASKPADPRPLSPHVSVWRWHATMASSILHRLTGIALYLGAVALSVWIILLAAGEEAKIAFLFEGFWNCALMAAMIGLTYAASYHWLNGLRHLLWDAGIGFSPKGSNLRSWLIISGALAPTALIWAPTFLGGAS